MHCPSQLILLAICTRNRAEALANCLQSVSKLTAPSAADVRILVVDNSESQAARETNAALVRDIHSPWAIAVEHQPQLGISFARNHALEAALASDADAVVFLDDDQTVPEDWLAVLVRAWREEAVDAMKSSVRELAREHFGRYDHSAIEELLRLHSSSRRRTGAKTLATNGVMISRRVFDEFRLRFDPRFALMGGEDTDFFHRARLLGASLAVTCETMAFEWRPENRRSLLALLRHGFRVGVCKAHLRQVYGRSSAFWLGRGLLWVVTGLLALPAVVWLPSKLNSTAKRMAEGAGLIVGLCGFRFEYYRVVPG
jgi:succinoglycan biosynthesis protein ExoM